MDDGTFQLTCDWTIHQREGLFEYELETDLHHIKELKMSHKYLTGTLKIHSMVVSATLDLLLLFLVHVCLIDEQSN